MMGRLCEVVKLNSEAINAMLDRVEELYLRFPIPKSPTKKRWIEAPAPELKELQQRLLKGLLYQLPAHHAAHGFVPGRSILTNARVHVGRRWVIALDIQEFFPSTRAAKIEEIVRGFAGLDDWERSAIVPLVTLRGRLPQGAPTSPHLANLAFFPLDVKLVELAKIRGFRYTRYADDLTFSGNRFPTGLVENVSEILEKGGYRLARKKTRIMGQGRRQKVTGLVVNDKVQLPREFRRWLRAILHDIRHRGLDAALSRTQNMTEARLIGTLSFQMMIDPDGLGRLISSSDEF